MTVYFIFYRFDLLSIDTKKTSIYLESLENYSNKNGDDDNNNDNNDTSKTVQLVKSTIQPTNQAREQASCTCPRRNNDVKKIQQQQLPSTRRVQDSPWFRWADAWKNQRTVKHAETKNTTTWMRVLCCWAKSSWKQWRPGLGRSPPKRILSESEKTKQLRLRSGLH